LLATRTYPEKEKEKNRKEKKEKWTPAVSPQSADIPSTSIFADWDRSTERRKEGKKTGRRKRKEREGPLHSLPSITSTSRRATQKGGEKKRPKKKEREKS